MQSSSKVGAEGYGNLPFWTTQVELFQIYFLKMSEMTSIILSQCMAMAQELTKTKQKAYINIRIWNEFHFEYSNQESEELYSKKRLSPSQMKRNLARRKNFEEKKIADDKTDDVKGDIETKGEIETLTNNLELKNVDKDTIEKIDSESQTEIKEFKTIGVNTEEFKVETLEDKLEVDKNGVIYPQKKEILVEMKVNHGIKNWEEIESIISDNLKLTLLGRPWIANNGRHFLTIGFRTKEQDYENWKLGTFNWQES